MQVCPRCRHANPDEAVFCHFDGAELRPAHGQAAPVLAPGQLAHDFVFPSGRQCTTYDDLIEACQEEWTTAHDLLRQGTFEQFLAGIGRPDLAQLAREAQGQPDADLALTAFLGGLPGTKPSGPRLDLRPRRLTLGTLHVGESRQVRLTVANQGPGVLSGSLTLAETSGVPGWVRLAEGPDHGPCPIHTAREQDFHLLIDTAGRPAGAGYAARLTVITNGGVVEVPLRMEVAAEPFPWPPCEGADSPRALAERMRQRPRESVPLLEGGEIARWFRVNGWHYPVRGPLAPGVAAVQQFFEAMGLARPPAVALSETEVRMAPVPPEVVRWQVTLFTEARKWIYAQVDSDVPWLKVLTPAVSGARQAAITFEVDSSLLEPGRAYAGQVHVHANAGQALAVQVRVDVQAQEAPLTGRLFRPFLGAALAGLMARLLLAPLGGP
jgi:hypothetical protein